MIRFDEQKFKALQAEINGSTNAEQDFQAPRLNTFLIMCSIADKKPESFFVKASLWTELEGKLEKQDKLKLSSALERIATREKYMSILERCS